MIARTSSMRYKGTKTPLDQIARELRVDYVIEGSVRSAADHVRITAQLIQVSDQTHLWADNYEKPVADVFAVQSEVADKVAASLAVKLLAERQAALSRPATSSAEAHEAYLHGRYYWEKRSKEGIEKAVDYFEQAIALDPDHALACLEAAFEAHDSEMVRLKQDPTLEPLRSDPRFQDLLRRMNFPR